MRNRIIELISLAMIFTACSSKKTAETDLFIGTYTNGSSHGIYSYRFNQVNGDFIPLDSVKTDNPSFLTLLPQKSMLYCVNENDSNTSAVTAIRFNRESGELHIVNRQPSIGAAPCYISTNGEYAASANFGGTINLFPIDREGKLLACKAMFQGCNKGADTIRQEAPHMHCAVFTSNGMLLASDFTGDRILCLELPKKAGSQLKAIEETDIPKGSGPRHIVFSTDRKFVYLISEISGDITVFENEEEHLKQIQSIKADSLNAQGSADIHLSPDGHYLYASNRLKGDGIAIFKVNSNGMLTPAGYQPTGKHPRNFAITPNGKYMLVACRDSNCIEIYERNLVTGGLKDTHKRINIDKPVCLQFLIL